MLEPTGIGVVAPSERGDPERSPDRRVAVPHHGFGPALGEEAGQFEAGGAGADDADPQATPGPDGHRRGVRDGGLTPEARVDATGVRQALGQAAVDALVESDARRGARAVGLEGLGDDLGVGHRGSGHADEICVSGGEHRLGLLQRGDPTGVDHRQVGRPADLAAQLGPRHVGVPRDLDVARIVPVAADVEAEVVEGPVRGERLDDLGAALGVVAALDALVEVEP